MDLKGPKRMFECFSIISLNADNSTSSLFQFPNNQSDKDEAKQYEKFCFPYKVCETFPIGQRHQHFTFMLTDLEKRHKYGFCKLTKAGKLCYCVVSALPWFEIFYKVLNCMCAVHTRNDMENLQSLLSHLYQMPISEPKEIVTVSASLTFCVPTEADLPSIPENRNLMEYYTAVNYKVMMEVFAALMFERRIIFTSSSLSILTGCVFAAEALIFPLTWQHIYIPILPPQIIDYCSAPMPFLVGMHTSLYHSIKDTPVIEEVVIVNLDTNEVQNPFDDLENMPSDAVYFLRSQLGKPNIAVGDQLSQAFLKAQVRLIGSYRSALKIQMGEIIIFDEQKFIELHKAGSRRNFAEELVQLQTFQQFIEKRLDMLNKGHGFQGTFEYEISTLQKQEGQSSNTLYKEWLSVAKKGGELIHIVKKRAKSNMKSAKQSMKDMKNAMKSTEDTGNRSTLRKRESLRESVHPLRPPRPPPPRPESLSVKPARPPPPKSPSVRRYKVISVIESEEEDDNYLFEENPLHSSSSSSLLDEINSDLQQDNKDIPLLIDLSLDSQPVAPPAPASSTTVSNYDLLNQALMTPSPPVARPRRKKGPFSPIQERDEQPSILPPRRASSIRRAENVRVRPHFNYNRRSHHLPQTSLSDDLFGLSFSNSTLSEDHGTVDGSTSHQSDWVNFSNSNDLTQPREGHFNSRSQLTSRSNGAVKTPSNEPLIVFDDF